MRIRTATTSCDQSELSLVAGGIVSLDGIFEHTGDVGADTSAIGFGATFHSLENPVVGNRPLG